LYTGGERREVESRELKVERKEENAETQKEERNCPSFFFTFHRDLPHNWFRRNDCPTRDHSGEAGLRSLTILDGW
jgi:hypothetical protein